MPVVELLRAWARKAPSRRAFTFLRDGEGEESALTFGELDARARAVAALLQRSGLAEQRILLLHPPGLEYVVGFLGCLYAGAVAVPVAPPSSGRSLPRLAAIARDARPAAALGEGASLARLSAMAGKLPELAGLRWLATDELKTDLEDGWVEPVRESGSLAFLQYTSGSTSSPKGVMVSLGNLVHNERMIQCAFEQTPESVIVSWLPLYHDMGLIGGVLQPLFAGARCVLMSPLAFLTRPARWLEAISRYRATTSGGPDFAYELCVRKVTGSQREGLDLSSWRVAFSGAEPVRPSTLSRFAAAFADCGFRRQAFYPCYGLAEATLFVAGGRVGREPAVARLAAAGLEEGRASAADAGRSLELVGCGGAWSGQEIAIVDPVARRRRAAGEVGEIWVRGESVAPGYWGNAAATAETFQARLADEEPGGVYLRTGDLGVVHGSELLITGRLKDLIILRGRNHYPQDLELTAECSHPALRPGCGAAFSVEVAGEERLVVAWELDPHARTAPETVAEAVRGAVAEAHEVRVHEVVLVRAGSIPRTTSGKVRRGACRAAYLDAAWTVVGRSGEERPELQESHAPGRPSRDDLLRLAPAERGRDLQAAVRREVASSLRLAVSQVPDAVPLIRLGLDSLAAVELKTALESWLGVTVPLGALLTGLDLGALGKELLARLADGEAAGRGPGAADASLQTDEDGDLPLLRGQQALWYLHHLAGESGAYNIAAAARSRSAVDPAALERALGRLADRHPLLRATLVTRGGEPRLRVHASLRPELQVIAGEEPAALRERLQAEAYRPFDLAAGPLLRLLVFQGRDGDVLLLSMHHIIADFWSLSVLSRELGLLYAEEAGAAAPAALPPLAASFRDAVRRQEERLAGPEGERLWQYWRGQLAGPLPVLALATDRPRPPVQTYRGASADLRLEPALAAAVSAWARAADTTPFVLLLTVFMALLQRYTGQDDLTVGVPALGRETAGMAGLVGYFVNPVVLRADLAGGPPCGQMVARVRETAAAALEHQDYPFALLAERLEPQWDPSRPRLFQAMFLWQKARRPEEQALAAFSLGVSGARVALGSLELESLALAEPGSQFELTLRAGEVDGVLALRLQHNADLFDATTARRLLEHFRSLVAAAAADPARRLPDLPLLSEGELAQVVREWNDTAVPVPALRCLHELFSEQAARTPGAVAVSCDGRRLSFAELEARSDQVAWLLRQRGVGRGARVGLCLERSPEMMVGILGTLKAGAAYVPLDPSHPRKRMAFILGQTGAGVLLTQRSLLRSLPRQHASLLALDDEALWAGVPQTRPEPVAEPGDLAYILYTSGSTGEPKGVMVEHRSVAHLAAALASTVYADAAAPLRVALNAPLVFDASVKQWIQILQGHRLEILPEEVRTDPRRLITALRDGSIDVLDCTPSQLGALLAAGLLREPGRKPGRVLVGGEDLPPALWRALAASPEVDFWNVYGPTECTVDAAAAAVRRMPDGPTLGRPLPNVCVHLLDPQLGLAPIGAVGELAIGGAGVARGYLARPDLTAERFVPAPWGNPGARIYCTGDLARFRPDGRLEFLGRADRQLKIRGFRIELGEIEAALAEHPGVREAVAVAREDQGGEHQIVAYVVCGGPAAAEADSLRSFLTKKLPAYMVPTHLVPLPSLPRTRNGKIDRAALPAPAPAQEAAGRRVAPRNPVEEVLAGMAAEILGVEAVSVDDNFFELGGHSLRAAELAGMVRETFGVELPLFQVFDVPTVAGMAAFLTEDPEQRRKVEEMAPIVLRLASRTFRFSPAQRRELAEEIRRQGLSSGPAILPRRDPGDRPLSFGQRRLWFLDQLEPGSAAYNMPALVRLGGRLDVGALRRAFAEIVRRHETLRTRFPVAAGEPCQMVSPAGPVPLAVWDLTALSGDRWEHALRLAREEGRRAFDLAAGPLIRLALLRLADDDHGLLVVLHHIIADAWSAEVLVRELGTLYGAFDHGRPSPLPELPIQYCDFAAWQQERWRPGDLLEARLAVWRRELADAPEELQLPADRPFAVAGAASGGQVRLPLPRPLVEEMRALGKLLEATPFMCLLAAFQALLCRWTGEDDLVVGSPVAGREQREAAGLIGFFVNLLPLRARVDCGLGWAALLERVRAGVLRAYECQDLPFDLLVEELRPRRRPGGTPVFQVLFGLEGTPKIEVPGLAATFLDLPAGGPKLHLALAVKGEGAGGMVAVLDYDAGRFDATTALRLLAQLRALLAAAVAQPHRALADLGLLSAAERHQLLVEWCDTAVLPGGLVPELFTAQAQRSPEAPALLAGAESLTYRELEAQSNQLARFLLCLGVREEDRVGVCLERSPHLVVALLGVLKSGATYLPLDPEHPGDRLAFVLEDAGARLAIATDATAGKLPDALPVFRLDRDRAAIERCSVQPPAGGPGARSLAYVIYTSGSTGRPKGVMIEHGSLAQVLAAGRRELGWTAGDCMPWLASATFDISLFELLSPLLVGGTCLVVGKDRLLDPAAQEELLARATRVHAVPALMAQLVAAARRSGRGHPHLRTLFVGGDVVPLELLVRMRETFPASEIRVLYGPTEGTIICSSHRIPGGETPQRSSLGRPLPGAELRLCDRWGQAVPIGAPGEIWIGGPGVARGYLGQAALTAERFPATPAGRFYRTGDLARWSPDGTLEFLGRLDQQVKVRGVRIEPGEVESALLEHPAVEAAAVVARRGETGSDALVAFLVATDGGPGPEELRASLGRRLPDALIPSLFFTVPALPLTPQGKVDRRSLREMAAAQPDGAAAYTAPRSALEELLAGTIAAVLQRERIGIHDNFFAIGGHSLKATQVVSQLRETLLIDLPVRTLFEAPTVAELAVAVVRAMAEQVDEQTFAATLTEAETGGPQEWSSLRVFP